MEGKVFCIGDIHGAYRALVQCLERSKFNNEIDTLISLGDIVDGWSETYECVEELLKIKNLIAIKGNHDEWFREFFEYSNHPVRWMQGGESTRSSYKKHCGHVTNANIPKTHIDFFNNQQLYYIDREYRMFTHGGWDRRQSTKDVEMYEPHEFYWNRSLWNQALSCKGNDKLNTIDNFSEIFIGHTPTISWGTDKPMNSGGVWNIDTGAGYTGKLSIIDINTKEYFQSDNVIKLYPDEKGRR